MTNFKKKEKNKIFNLLRQEYGEAHVEKWQRKKRKQCFIWK